MPVLPPNFNAMDWVTQQYGPQAAASMLNPDGSLREPGLADPRSAAIASAPPGAGPPPMPAGVATSWDQLGQFDAKGNQVGPPVQTTYGPPAPPPPQPPVGIPVDRQVPFKTGSPQEPSPVASPTPSVVAGSGQGTATKKGPSAVMMAANADTKAIGGKGELLDQAKTDASEVNALRDKNNAVALDLRAKADLDMQILKGINASDESKSQEAMDAKMKEFTDHGNKSPDQQVDAERYMKSMGMGGKIVTAISLFLGGLGGGFSQRGGNAAADMLNQKIERDVYAQKVNIDNSKSKWQHEMAVKSTAYGLARQKFGDTKLASLAAQNSLLTEAQNKVNLLMQQTQDAEAKSRGSDLLRALDERKLDNTRQAEQVQVGVKAVQEQKDAASAQARARAASDQYWAERNVVTDKNGNPAQYIDQNGVPRPLSFRDGPNGINAKGDLTPGLARSQSAATTALDELTQFKDLSDKTGVNTNVVGSMLKPLGHGSDSDLDAQANHLAESIASAEKNGMVPDPHRVDEIRRQLSAVSPEQRAKHIKNLMIPLKARLNSNIEVSSHVKGTQHATDEKDD